MSSEPRSPPRKIPLEKSGAHSPPQPFRGRSDVSPRGGESSRLCKKWGQKWGKSMAFGAAGDFFFFFFYAAVRLDLEEPGWLRGGVGARMRPPGASLISQKTDVFPSRALKRAGIDGFGVGNPAPGIFPTGFCRLDPSPFGFYSFNPGVVKLNEPPPSLSGVPGG